MPWPTVAVTTTGMDADTDSMPRSDILDLATKFNQLIAMRGVASGVCDLDSDTLVPISRIPSTIQRQGTKLDNLKAMNTTAGLVEQTGADAFTKRTIGFASGNITPAAPLASWGTAGAASNVAGLIGWKNGGNGFVVFDASAGTSPAGTAVNQTNSSAAWVAGNPTLMGWNGSGSNGVRVDSARVADAMSSPMTASAEYSVVYGTTLSVSHGLAAAPSRLRVVIRCKTAEHGYVAGDEIDITSSVFDLTDSTDRRTIAAGATQVHVLILAGIVIINRSTAISAGITVGNWRVVIYSGI